LTARLYPLIHEDEALPMRLIAALVGTLTLLVLVIPIHP
jgi:hypothetical protein